MTEQGVKNQIVQRWYTRPVLFAVKSSSARFPTRPPRWGFDVIQVDDPVGNELLFPTSE